MKKSMQIGSALLVAVALFFLCAPTYVREALVHWFPDITDTYIFPARTVAKADTCWDFPLSRQFNTYEMTPEENAYLDKYGTVAYIVIRQDSVLYEEYREKWTPQTLANIFSATKSIVGLLAGIACDEGYIESIDDKVGKYLPEFQDGEKITVRNLLTMSSGLNWDESYSSLFSKTTQAYYGDRIRDLVMGLKVVEEPGKRYAYKSGDTQLLAFVIEAALAGKGDSLTISEYASRKLWEPIGACHDALWNLDRKDGDEKTYCCFNTTARDFAHIGRLILDNGRWNGRQVVSEEYLREATTPAAYLENEFGDGALDYYGFQIWIMHYRGMSFPAFRGLGGQYLFVIPEKQAIVVRMGHERSDEYQRENTVDMEEYLNMAFRILQ